MQHPPSQAPTTDSTEHFLVYGYKVVPCSKRYRHDWSVCPFAHTGEMAARRDPSRYIPIFCFHSKQRLPCPRGDECPYSHNLFEYWLHPKRYRTEMCQFGAACTRPVCFFAHGDHQLRHTDMPGGPQPVVAPPEPVPSLNSGGFGRDLSSPIDPALKQQQQLMALQAAAVGFSHQQQGQQHQQHPAHQRQQHGVASGMGMDTLSGSLQHVGSYPSMVGSGVDAGMGGMGGAAGMGMAMGNLQHPLGGLTSSSPLSAPLPQLSPDMLAALQSMNNGAGGGSSMSPMGHALMHHHSGIPTSQYADALPASGRLQRSLTAHPAVNAAAAAAAANDNSQNLHELSKQLAFMQLMGSAAGGPDASGTLADLGAAQSVDTLLLAQLQQQQQHQAAAAAAAAAAVTAGLDLSGLLPVTSYGQPADGSLSCPLPPVFGNGGALGGQGGVPTSLQQLASAGVLAGASLNLPRVPTAPGSVFSPTSPIGSDTGRDAPSPVGAGGRDTGRDAPSPVGAGGRDTGRDAPSPVGAGGRDTQVPAPSKKAHRWSAPASPTNSCKGGNDLVSASDDAKHANGVATQLSSSASSTSSAPGGGGSNSQLHSIPSCNLARHLSGSDGAHDISFSAGVAPGGLAHAGSGSSTDASSALLMVGDSPLQAAQVHAALSGSLEGVKGQQHQQHAASSMGKEKAAQLLAQLPEDQIQKLLALVQQGGGQ